MTLNGKVLFRTDDIFNCTISSNELLKFKTDVVLIAPSNSVVEVNNLLDIAEICIDGKVSFNTDVFGRSLNAGSVSSDNISVFIAYLIPENTLATLNKSVSFDICIGATTSFNAENNLNTEVVGFICILP